MAYLLRGALIQYGSGLIGPIPNIVIFQFNPESLTRSLRVPPRPQGASARETTQAGDITIETISFKAQFSAADLLKDNKALARGFGIGPQLCALEQMAHPTAKLAGLIGAALDAIGSALGIGGGGDPPTQAIPRENYPRLIFIWGTTRVLPVMLNSLRITELLYDPLLNPIQADVDIELTVNEVDSCSDDDVAKGAFQYTALAKEAQAIANLANTASQAVELIPF